MPATVSSAFIIGQILHLDPERCRAVWLDVSTDLLAARAARLPSQGPFPPDRVREARAELAAALSVIYALAHLRIRDHRAGLSAIVDAIAAVVTP